MARGKSNTVESFNTTVPEDPRLQVYKHILLVNEGDEPYEMSYKGNTIKWEVGEAKKFRRHEGLDIRGCYDGRRDKYGNLITKKLKVVPVFPTYEEAGLAGRFECQITGKAFNTQEDLEIHLKDLRGKLNGNT